MNRIRLPKFTEEDLEQDTINNPNLWFAKMFPIAAHKYGPAFLQRTFDDADGLTRFVPEQLNIDFFAAALAGDKALGHRVIFYLPEEIFYFFEPRLLCYCPTSEDKLVALLSSYLVRCAQDAGCLVNIQPLFSDFRKMEVLNAIVRRARALLAADLSFFKGEHGHRRLFNGKLIEPLAVPSYELFIKQTVTRKPHNAFTVSDAFSRYYQFCQALGVETLTRAEFKGFATEVIRDLFQIGLRRDVIGPSGKQSEGWHGIGCSLERMIKLGSN
jgi:hypothetical protein